MFETALLSNKKDSKRGWGTLAGFTGQAVVVTLAVIAPMIWPAALPHAVWAVTLEPPGPPPPPPPPPPTGPRFTPKPTRPFQASGSSLVTPTAIPPKPIAIVDPPEVPGAGGISSGVVGGQGTGIPGGVISTIIAAARPAAPVPHVLELPAPPKPNPTPTRPVRVTSSVELAHPISRVDPIYPQLARQMHIQGVVELQGVLGTDGRIHELKVLRGHPLLIKAAVDAVMQWVYTPTVLNGQPVEVQAPIIVTFKLN